MPVLRVRNTPTQPLSEWGIVRAAVAFANGEDVEIECGTETGSKPSTRKGTFDDHSKLNQSQRRLTEQQAPDRKHIGQENIRYVARERIADLLVDPAHMAR